MSIATSKGQLGCWTTRGNTAAATSCTRRRPVSTDAVQTKCCPKQIAWRSQCLLMPPQRKHGEWSSLILSCILSLISSSMILYVLVVSCWPTLIITCTGSTAPDCDSSLSTDLVADQTWHPISSSVGCSMERPSSSSATVRLAGTTHMLTTSSVESSPRSIGPWDAR
jgi:hypothetical protein